MAFKSRVVYPDRDFRARGVYLQQQLFVVRLYRKHHHAIGCQIDYGARNRRGDRTYGYRPFRGALRRALRLYLRFAAAIERRDE